MVHHVNLIENWVVSGNQVEMIKSDTWGKATVTTAKHNIFSAKIEGGRDVIEVAVMRGFVRPVCWRISIRGPSTGDVEIAASGYRDDLVDALGDAGEAVNNWWRSLHRK